MARISSEEVRERRAILQCALQADPVLSVREASRITGSSEAICRRWLDEMVADDLAEQTATGKYRWIKIPGKSPVETDDWDEVEEVEEVRQPALSAATARKAATVASDGLIGVPVAPPEIIHELQAAVDAVLACGRILARVLDRVDPGSGIEKWICGCLNTQSRDGAMMRMMVDQCKSGGAPD